MTSRTYESQQGAKRVVCILRKLGQGSEIRNEASGWTMPEAGSLVSIDSPDFQSCVEYATWSTSPDTLGGDRDDR